MANIIRDVARLLRAVETAPTAAQARLKEASDLDLEELELIKSALFEHTGPPAELAKRLLDEWGNLTVPERTAGLLLLAQELAGLRKANHA
jgi:hypothetical protein